MSKDTNLGTPRAGSGSGENILRGLQQGWTGMGKSEKTQRPTQVCRWPKVPSTRQNHYVIT